MSSLWAVRLNDDRDLLWGYDNHVIVSLMITWYHVVSCGDVLVELANMGIEAMIK